MPVYIDHKAGFHIELRFLFYSKISVIKLHVNWEKLRISNILCSKKWKDRHS